MISHRMGACICPGLHCQCDILAWIHSASTRTAHCPLQAAFYGVISAFLWRSASKYGAMPPGHCAVPVRRSLRCSPGVEFRSMRFTNRVQTYSSRLHQIASASGLVASSRSAAAGAGSSASTAGCLQAGLSRRGSRQAGPPSWLHVCDEVFG